jgi:hypothetical protein
MSLPPNSQLPANWEPRPPSPPPPLPRQPITQAQWGLVGLILLFFLCSISLRIIYQHRLETTAVMFVGLPAGLAIVMSLVPRSKSALGSAMKGTTIGLLISAILFGEGVVCVLMAAPIAYFVAAIVGVAADASLKNRNRTPQCVVWFVVAATSFEGVSNSLSMPRDEVITVQRTVAATPVEIEAALSATPSFRTQLPLYFRIGFPKPVEAHGSGLQIGAQRVIHFAGGEGAPGDEIFLVAAHTNSSVTFHPLSDSSHIAHWLAWKESLVEWSPVDASHTRVTWTLRFRRGLDPAWYFRPSERYAARLAAGYLIDNLATPTQKASAH